MKQMNSKIAAALAGAVAGLALTFFAGCGGGGGGGGSSGSSTITGTISSYKTTASLYQPALPARGIEKILATISDLVVPSAQAGVGGVTIRVKGTDLAGTTAGDGLFVISGVASGTRTLVFEFNGDSIEVEVEVPSNSTVHLDGIRCDGGSSGSDDDGSIEVENEHVEHHGGDDDGSDHDSGDDGDNSNDDGPDDDEDNHDNDPNHT